MRKITIFIILAFLLAFGAAPAYAQPAFPHAFYGSVYVNGSLADDGTQVSAKVDDGTIIPTQNPVLTVGGNYGITSLKLLVQGNIPPGATISFYVKGVEVEGVTATFEAGGGPTKRDLSVTIAVPPEPPAPPAPPLGTTDVRGMVSTAGRFYSSATAYTEERACWLTIPAGTVGLTEELEPLTLISMLIMDDPPPPPKGAHIIGLPHDFQPSGTTFDPPATLTCSYDPGNIPEGIAEGDLVQAYYDQAAGKWVELEGCVVDTVANTITASLSHFTTFAIIGAVTPAPPVVAPPPAPAAFSLSNLTVQPALVEPDETVTITVSVANTGGTEGTYTVVLMIEGVKEAEKSLTIAAGSSLDVSFSVAKEDAGTYSVDVDGLSGSFTVAALPAPPIVPPEVEPPTNWPLIGGIIAAVIVVGLLIFFLVRRRAH